MKKYNSTISNNNNLKEEVVTEVNALIYKVSKGRYNKSLNEETMNNLVETLKEDLNDFENAVGTGKENIEKVYKDTKTALDKLKNEIDNPLTTKVENAFNELTFSLNMWKDVVNGEVVDIEAQDMKKAKLSWSKRRLMQKLQELKSIKQAYATNERRLENDIKDIEKELAELEDKMVEEENERLINELFRRVQSTKSKVNDLNTRRKNYSICFDLMDRIDLNIEELINAGEYATEELNKAKGLLNLNKLKETEINPERAVTILKIFQDEMEEINKRIKAIETKVFGQVDGETTVTSDAMAYKEELLRKRREKNILKNANNEIDLKMKENKPEQQELNDVDKALAALDDFDNGGNK